MDDERETRRDMWNNWNKQRNIEKNLQGLGFDSQDSDKTDYLAELTYKIAERTLGQPQQKQNNTKDIILEKRVCKEVEANTCAVCFELMVPPNFSPILLFPCGHTFCKNCLMEKRSGKLQLQKCPVCRQMIKSHAVNISLQNLICTFTDQRHLLDRVNDNINCQQDDGEGVMNQQGLTSDFDNLYKMYRMRCEILQNEQEGIQTQVIKYNDELQIQCDMIDQLKRQREECISKIKNEESKLENINSILDRNLERVEILNEKLRMASEKDRLIDQTLKPLQMELQKYQILSQK